MKTMILTGASGGLGTAITSELLRSQQIKVYGIGRTRLTIQDENYHHIESDFSKPKQLEQILKTEFNSLKQIDGLILAAGYGVFHELEQFSLEEMENLINVNFLSQALLCKYFLPRIKKTPESKIIAIGSESSIQGAKKGTMYCASKFALRGFIQSLRAECSRSHVAVTIINPGIVDTPFFKNLNFRPGEDKENSIKADQIAKTILFILSLQNTCVVEEINLQPLKKVIIKNGCSHV